MRLKPQNRRILRNTLLKPDISLFFKDRQKYIKKFYNNNSFLFEGLLDSPLKKLFNLKGKI